MSDMIRNAIVSVASGLSVVALCGVVSLYVDVQILKVNQSEQSDFVSSTKDILNRIDKTQAVQAETIKTLSEVVQNLKYKENSYDRRD